MSRTLKHAVLCAASMLAIGSASASVVFDSVGDKITTTYSGTVNGALLTASVYYELTNLTSNTARFSVEVKNLTLDTATGDNKLVGYGISVVNPDLKSASSGSNVFNAALVDTKSTLPGGINVEFCNIVSVGENNCFGGNPQTGLAENSTNGTFDLDFEFDTSNALSGVTFGDPFFVRYQAVGTNSTGSAKLISECTESNGCTERPPEEIPEPGSIALAGLALLAAGYAKRRRKV